MTEPFDTNDSLAEAIGGDLARATGNPLACDAIDPVIGALAEPLDTTDWFIECDKGLIVLPPFFDSGSEIGNTLRG